jgi:hypothetical protein
MRIKTQNGKILTKNGRVSCECCEVFIICEKPLSSLVDYNTFEITREEYEYYLNGGKISLDYNIDHQESYQVDPTGQPLPFDISGEFSFNKSGLVDFETDLEPNCGHIYTATITAGATYRETYLTTDTDYENVGGDVSIVFELSPILFIENDSFFVNFDYQITMAVTADEENREDIIYASSFFLDLNPSDPEITGYIDQFDILADGNSLEIQKTYRGPGGLTAIYIPNNFFAFADGYVNNSNISFEINLEDL